MNISPELAAKKAKGKRYTELMQEHPELKAKAMAMIDAGHTISEIVDELDDGGKASWNRITAKLNKQLDIVSAGRAE